MTVDSSLVDRIVSGVLQQMRGTAPAAPKPTVAAVAPVAPPRVATEHRLAHPVVTAGLIEEQVPRGTSQLVVTPRAVITPAALDVIRSRKIVVRRETAAPKESEAASRVLGIVVRNTPVLERLFQRARGSWKRELLGCPDDAAKLAISALCRGEVDRIVIFAAQHHRAACLANRNSQVKAVAIASVDDLKAAREQIRVNVVCVDPTNRGDFELSRMLDG